MALFTVSRLNAWAATLMDWPTVFRKVPVDPARVWSARLWEGALIAVNPRSDWAITWRGWEIALMAVSCLNDCAKIPMDWPRLRRKLLEDWARAWMLRV
jgi:hypothetical protein